MLLTHKLKATLFRPTIGQYAFSDNPGQNFRDTFTFLQQNRTIRSPLPPPLNNVGCPGLKHVSKILVSLSTSTLFRGGGGNKFLIFFSDLTLSAIFLFHKKLLQKCQLSLNQLARIVANVLSHSHRKIQLAGSIISSQSASIISTSHMLLSSTDLIKISSYTFPKMNQKVR